MLLVERHLTHTVDGVVGEVGHFRHTVLSASHHHTATEDAAEVGTLDTVHQTTGIDGQYTAFLPEFGPGHPFASLLFKDSCSALLFRGNTVTCFFIHPYRRTVIFQEQHQQVIGIDRRSLGGDIILFLAGVIACAILVSTGLQAFVFQLIVGCLAIGQGLVGINIDLRVNRIIVGAIVRNVQTTIAVDQGEVTIAVETTDMMGAQGDKVAVVDVMDGGGGVAIDGDGVGIDNRALYRVTTGKHSVMDDDTCRIQTTPPGSIILLVPQGVQNIDRHIVARGIVFVDGNTSQHLCIRLNQHLTVFGKNLLLVFAFTHFDISVALIFIIVTFVIVCWIRCFNINIKSFARLLAITHLTELVFVGAVNETIVTATEHIAGVLGQATLGSDFTTVDMYHRLAKDITLSTAVHGLLFLFGHITFRIPVVVTTTATEHVSQHMTAVHLKTSGAWLVDDG